MPLVSETPTNMALNLSAVNASDPTGPKGYDLPHLIVTVIIVSIIIILIIFGNLLVVIAVYTDRNLKTIQNWFIASLALADSLLGLVIMPFSLANEVMGYWYFGPVWCDLWKTIDVFLCTASILNICLISLDRYFCITRALTYTHFRTPGKAILMMASVWVVSTVICVPPLIGWKNPLKATEYPLCLLSSETGYIIYSAMGSFYIPAIIMVMVYYQIYRAAKLRARRGNKKDIKKKEQKKKTVKNEMTADKQELKPMMGPIETVRSDARSIMDCATAHSDDETTWPMYDKPIPVNNACEKDHTINADGSNPDEMTKLIPATTLTENNEHKSENSSKSTEGDSVDVNGTISKQGNEKAVSVTTTNNGETRTEVCKKPVARNLSHPTKKDTPKQETDVMGELEKQKKKLAKARERRATIVLGLVMAAFILCWFPFFTLYIISSLCEYCIPVVVFNVFFWAGYCNSALNPIIYTVFNREFRNAFHKIVFKNELCRRR
ncbi:alpha-2A adrenergic receptor-like [Mizuhopecten yessoensis]|uniref:Alpha-2 adrenergic receptor n=1 Tax=Mizuhopecten yessoensis TaxID=6573 RepID=A0A210Q215_MIZYE|nr:alpha-2A adrenergic receptor-like [Mizuhopecten yessoensis]OWF42719.1 Alpha-2 adrenergic receptor [Mizuhopecten yessoensis]